MSSKFPRVVRDFHLPQSNRPSFVSGSLQVSGLLSFLFPKSPVNVVVRSKLQKQTDEVYWLRNFGGRLFIPSVYSRSIPLIDALHDQKEIPPSPLHDVESVFPFHFHLDWEGCQTNDTLKISPKLLKTTLLGIIPVPKLLLAFNLSLIPLRDNSGWTLSFDVNTFGGLIKALGYDGELRPVTTDTNYISGFHHLVSTFYISIPKTSFGFTIFSSSSSSSSLGPSVLSYFGSFLLI
jgi:hypothetical protein